MEHPDVIREIDALIDSYNWSKSVRDPDKATGCIKQAMRNGEVPTPFWLGNQESQLIMFQLCLEILKHPRLRHKDWVLETLYGTSIVSFRLRRQLDPFSIQKYRALQNAVPFLRHYMKHRKASYRRYAAATLSCLIYQANQVASWFIKHLQHENSFQVVFEIFKHLRNLFSGRSGAA